MRRLEFVENGLGGIGEDVRLGVGQVVGAVEPAYESQAVVEGCFYIVIIPVLVRIECCIKGGCEDADDAAAYSGRVDEVGYLLF